MRSTFSNCDAVWAMKYNLMLRDQIALRCAWRGRDTPRVAVKLWAACDGFTQHRSTRTGHCYSRPRASVFRSLLTYNMVQRIERFGFGLMLGFSPREVHVPPTGQEDSTLKSWFVARYPMNYVRNGQFHLFNQVVFVPLSLKRVKSCNDCAFRTNLIEKEFKNVDVLWQKKNWCCKIVKVLTLLHWKGWISPQHNNLLHFFPSVLICEIVKAVTMSQCSQWVHFAFPLLICWLDANHNCKTF